MKLRINSNLQCEVKEVCDFVSDHRCELEREYQYNRLHGAD